LWWAILLSFPISGLREEWFILLLLVILLTDYCLRFDKGVVHIIVADYNVEHLCLTKEWTITVSCLTEGRFILLWLVILLIDYCLRFVRQGVSFVVAGYFFGYCCLKFDREVVCIVVAGYIVDHYCLMFNIGVVHIVVAVLLLTITV
jgi:hypothetical protein